MNVMAAHGLPGGTVFVQVHKEESGLKNKKEKSCEKESEGVLTENSKAGNSM